MRRFGTAILVMALLAMTAGLARAEDKKEGDKAKVKVDNGKLIVGTWKVTDAEGLPEGALVEFTKDGKLSLTAEMDGNKIKLEGTYKIEGDKLHTAVKFGDNEMEDTDTIKLLTEEKLTLLTKEGKEQKFEKVKKKK